MSTLSASRSCWSVVASRTSSEVAGVVVAVVVGRNISGGWPTRPRPWGVRSGVGKGLMTSAATPSGYAVAMAPTVCAQSRGGRVTIAQLCSAEGAPPRPAHQSGPSANVPRAAVVRARAQETCARTAWRTSESAGARSASQPVVRCSPSSGSIELMPPLSTHGRRRGAGSAGSGGQRGTSARQGVRVSAGAADADLRPGGTHAVVARGHEGADACDVLVPRGLAGLGTHGVVDHDGVGPRQAVGCQVEDRGRLEGVLVEAG